MVNRVKEENRSLRKGNSSELKRKLSALNNEVFISFVVQWRLNCDGTRCGKGHITSKKQTKQVKASLSAQKRCHNKVENK